MSIPAVELTLLSKQCGDLSFHPHSSNYDPIKTYPKIDDQMPVLVKNVAAALNKTPLTHHVKGASYFGRLDGPLLVALGHGHADGYGLGPDLPGCLGWLCWGCCCFGWPCSAPAGRQSAKAKSDFNNTIKPKPGVGLH